MRVAFRVGIAGAACSAIALLTTCVSMATDHWLEETVDERELTKLAVNDSRLASMLLTPHWLYADRHRGLFQTCYRDDVIDCEGDMAFWTTSNNATDSYRSNGYYNTRTRMVRAVLSLMIFTVMAAFVSFACGIISTFRTFFNCRIYAKVSAFASCFAAACIICAMALFHAIDDYERNKIVLEPFPAGWSQLVVHEHLAKWSDRSFGYSYFLGWVSLVLHAVTCVLMLVGMPDRSASTDTDVRSEMTVIDMSVIPRNNAYNMMERQVGDTDVR